MQQWPVQCAPIQAPRLPIIRVFPVNPVHLAKILQDGAADRIVHELDRREGQPISGWPALEYLLAEPPGQ